VEEAIPADEELLRDYRRACIWSATLDRVRNLGDYSLHWFRLQLRRFQEVLARGNTPTADEPSQAPAKGQTPVTHPDGPDGGRWVWWGNKRYDVPQGVVYRMIEFMWTRDRASYDLLEDEEVFESTVAPQTVRSSVNKVNNALPSGFPWRLSADSVSRRLTKIDTCKNQ
jgi:hypothetical protein